MRVVILIGVVAGLLLEFQSAGCGSRNNRSPSKPPVASSNVNEAKMDIQTDDQEPDEIWGGEHIHIDLTGEVAKVEFDCAHGEISKALKADAQGNFDLPGTFVRESGGPVRDDRQADARTVNYRGKIEGDSMTLSITFSDNNESVGTYTLKRGKHGRIRKCM